jgi:hypothetical protein
MKDFKEKYTNGKIPLKVLKPIDTGQSLERNASNSYMRMKNDAKKDGVNIDLSGMYSAYRPCGEKGDYNERKCRDGFTQWCAWEKYKRGVGNPASNPTTSKGCKSNHGWGIAIDVKGSSAKKWIRQNGEKYGWWWGEAITEDWHFTYDYKRDKYLKENQKQDKKTPIVLYVFLGLVVVGFGYTLYALTRPK